MALCLPALFPQTLVIKMEERNMSESFTTYQPKAHIFKSFLLRQTIM